MKDKIKDYYAAIAQTYAVEYGWQYVDTAVLELFRDYLKSHKVTTLVDLACGNGKVSKFFAQQGFKVAGIDYCDQMLFIAQSLNAHPNVSYSNLDLRAWSLPQNKGAYTLLFALIHWPEEEQKIFLAEFVKKIEPGSFILLSAQLGDENYEASPISKTSHITVYCWKEKQLLDLVQSLGCNIKFAMKRTPWSNEIPREKLFLILEKP